VRAFFYICTGNNNTAPWSVSKQTGDAPRGAQYLPRAVLLLPRSPAFYMQQDDTISANEFNPDDSVNHLFSFFISRFKPAASASDATQQLSTFQIFEQMQEHCPGAYTAKDVYDLLYKAGYKFNMSGGELNFVWLLKLQ